jgi:hypothetical protein
LGKISQKNPEISPAAKNFPVSRPREAPKNLPKSSPKSAKSPAVNPFQNIFVAPRAPPELPLLTRFKMPGVKSPLVFSPPSFARGTLQLPKYDPLAQPRPETERKRCRCPKPKKAKPGRGFFRVDQGGQVRKTYWKTGKHHNKEYRSASNSSRSVSGGGRKQLEHLLRLSV